MEVRVPHGLGAERAAERVREAARRHDLAVDDGSGGAGTAGGRLQRKTPLGAVEGRWEARESEVVVFVESRPAFLPEGTVRRLLEEGLREALAERP